MSNEITWETFGFPHPGFMPVWKPAEGLMKALEERRLPFAEKWDFDTIAKEDQLKLFAEVSNGQLWCKEFDSHLKELAVKYLNHTKMKNNEHLDFSKIMWTWEELQLAAADGKKERIADPAKGDLSPEWNLEWLLQRRKALNLLRYAPYPHKYEYKTGSTHTGVPDTPAESVAAALAAVQPSAADGGLPAITITNIYGPDHGWREGSYCCDIVITTKIFVELPEGFKSDDNVFLCMSVTGADGTDDSFKSKGKISVGYNQFTADEEGVFVTFDYSDKEIAQLAGTPVKDRTTSGGWRSTRCQAFVDFTPIFKFKEKEKSEE